MNENKAVYAGTSRVVLGTTRNRKTRDKEVNISLTSEKRYTLSCSSIDSLSTFPNPQINSHRERISPTFGAR